MPIQSKEYRRKTDKKKRRPLPHKIKLHDPRPEYKSINALLWVFSLFIFIFFWRRKERLPESHA